MKILQSFIIVSLYQMQEITCWRRIKTRLKDSNLLVPALMCSLSAIDFKKLFLRFSIFISRSSFTSLMSLDIFPILANPSAGPTVVADCKHKSNGTIEMTSMMNHLERYLGTISYFT
jgi:hypothetical protein